MSERDTTPVTINLDRQRPYRANDEDREAIWVGPGEVSVPSWVAEHWGPVETPAPTPEPTPAPDPQPAAAEPSDLSDLGLTDEQIDALQAHGYGDREAIRKAGYDELLSVPTIGRATVGNLRKQLAPQEEAD